MFPYNGNLLLDNASPIIEITSEASDSIAILAPKDAEENEQDYTNLENFQSPTLVELDSIDAAKRKWGTADTFTDPLRTFLQEMTVDFTANQFLGETKTQLIQLVEGVKKSSKYKTIVVGIMGKNKRQKELSQPFLNFMEEFNLTQEQIYIISENDLISWTIMRRNFFF